jgi:hypothetical protein
MRELLRWEDGHLWSHTQVCHICKFLYELIVLLLSIGFIMNCSCFHLSAAAWTVRPVCLSRRPTNRGFVNCPCCHLSAVRTIWHTDGKQHTESFCSFRYLRGNLIKNTTQSSDFKTFYALCAVMLVMTLKQELCWLRTNNEVTTLSYFVIRYSEYVSCVSLNNVSK